MRSIVGIARADFKERSRRFSFIAIMAAALFLAFWFVPQEGGGIQVMAIQPDRFVQGGNPTWIPLASAWGLGFFLPLVGFFYLRNAIAFDEKSGVSQLISSSPVGNVRYMLGKLCSGTLLLYCAAAVVIIGSFFMTLWHFPGERLTVNQFLSPFVFLLTALPLCCAVVLLFESVRFMRGAVGSVLFIAAFITMYVLVSEAEVPGVLLRSFDFSGTSVIFHTINNAVLEQSGQPMGTLMFLGTGIEFDTPPTMQLVFNGVPVTTADIQGFAGMICAALGLTVLSAPLYGFFKKDFSVRLSKKSRTKEYNDSEETRLKPIPSYMPAAASGNARWVSGIAAEMRLMLNGQRFLWMLVSLAGVLLSIFLDLEYVQIYVMPLLMIWFINVFSAMGSREYQYDMLGCISVIPGGRLKQIMFSWVSGMLIALTLVLPVIVRMLIAGQTAGIFAAFASIVFLPSLALFLGEFTKTRRGFELTLVAVTYLILNDVTAVMYMGMHPDVISVTRSGIYMAAGLALGVAAVLKRTKA